MEAGLDVSKLGQGRSRWLSLPSPERISQKCPSRAASDGHGSERKNQRKLQPLSPKSCEH